MSIALIASELSESEVRQLAALPFVISALAVAGTWLGYVSVRKRFFKDFKTLETADLKLSFKDVSLDEKLKSADLEPDPKIEAKIRAIFTGAKNSQFFPSAYHAGPLQQRFDRDTDAATSFASGILVVFTALVVLPEAGRGIVILFAAIGALGSFGIFTFIFNAELGTYSKTVKKGVSLLSVLILVINLVLGIVAYNTIEYTPPPSETAGSSNGQVAG